MDKNFTEIRSLKLGLCILAVIGAAACTAIEPRERVPQRTMNVSGGPERVFDESADAILPELAGAVATGSNGRVGNQLVFWEYRLQDNSRTNFFACAQGEEIDCDTRIRQICPGGGEEHLRKDASGLVRHLDCEAIGIASPGELFPNCTDTEQTEPLLVGLMECR